MYPSEEKLSQTMKYETKQNTFKVSKNNNIKTTWVSIWRKFFLRVQATLFII